MSNVIARTEKAIEDFDAGLIAHLDLDEAVKMIISRAAAAEARAADLQARLDAMHSEHDQAVAEWERTIRRAEAAEAERDRANQGFAALKHEYDKAMTRLAAHGEKVTA